ncbi:phosphotransferase family protein [Novosphingobium sp.]|uniref:phosphotransferase family protein n=1 Tax=Novosphingobium sp. TaxID=1874826 RepID=UPI0026240FD9|nr:phosphotransferase family protein [Novosphingobium sp.]
MALSNQIDTEKGAIALASYLSQHHPAAEWLKVIDLLVPTANGLSNETILFTMVKAVDGQETAERLVARVQPSGPAVHPSYDMEREFRLLKIIGERTSVPVPSVVSFEPGKTVLGAPFLLLKFVAGKVPGDDPLYTTTGWVLELTDSQRSAMSFNALEALAKIHAVDWLGLGLDFLDKPEFGPKGLAQELNYIRAAYEWGRAGFRHPVIEAAFDWIEQNIPTGEEPLALTWGDARIGNMIFAEDQSVAAVLDWELAAIASPEMDLGWWLFLQRAYTDAIDVPLPGGLFDREKLVAEYERMTGHIVRNLDFYEIFAVLRGSIQMLRVGTLLIEAGLLASDSPIRAVNPTVNLLADLIGVPRLDGQAESWVGNRT